MTKAELFKKYHIDESHSKWDNSIDNWMSIEVYRVMHNGNLPPQDDMSVDWIIKFLEKIKKDAKFGRKMIKRKDFGSLYLTTKRMIYRFADKILEDNEKQK